MPDPGHGWHRIHYSQMGLCMASVQKYAAGAGETCRPVSVLFAGLPSRSLPAGGLTADAETVLRTMLSSLPLQLGI